MSHGIKIFFPPASTSFSPSTFPWMLLGKTVAYSPLLHDNTVNYTRPHVLHMLYALIQMPLHPLCTLPLFPLFLKTNIDILWAPCATTIPKLFYVMFYLPFSPIKGLHHRKRHVFTEIIRTKTVVRVCSQRNALTYAWLHIRHLGTGDRIHLLKTFGRWSQCSPSSHHKMLYSIFKISSEVHLMKD